MGFLDGVRAMFNAGPPIQERDVSTLEDFALRILGNNRSAVQPWRAATMREALGVPAVFGAVTLISNVVGSMTLRAIRRGVELGDEDRPRLIVRPNPFTTPRVFFRDTAFHLATRGEAWWWIGARDIDGAALSLVPVNPVEVTVTVNDRDALRPVIEWRGRRIANEDMIQITYLPSSDGLRGIGPLQACQAAVSVAVESQEWAANFYGDGGYPSTLIKSASELTAEEADVLRTAWISKANNVPRIIDPGIEEVKQFNVNEQGSGMLAGRDFSNGDVARMFRIPGPMLGWSVAGSSLTYQNVGQQFDELVRGCLLPNYLEPMEQAISDLLSRSTVAKFNTEALLRADIRTRYEVYGIGIDKGILSVEEARQKEGLEPGDIENAPVPLALPQAIPTSLPMERSAAEVRCSCGALLADLASPPYRFRCRKCKQVTSATAPLTEERSTAQPVVINMPEPVPMTVRVETGMERLMSAVSEQVVAFAEDLAELEQRREGDRAEFASKLGDLTQRTEQMAQQVAAPRKPRRLIPRRDAQGLIVAVDEVSAA